MEKIKVHLENPNGGEIVDDEVAGMIMLSAYSDSVSGLRLTGKIRPSLFAQTLVNAALRGEADGVILKVLMAIPKAVASLGDYEAKKISDDEAFAMLATDEAERRAKNEPSD